MKPARAKALADVLDQAAERLQQAESKGRESAAIEVLREYARHERNFCYSLEHLRNERRDLSAEIKKLKALRLRLRGEVRLTLPELPLRAGVRKWDYDNVANLLLDHILARMPKDEP